MGTWHRADIQHIGVTYLVQEKMHPCEGWEMRKERGPRPAGAGSGRTAWQRSGLWEVEGLRAVGGSGDTPCHTAVPSPMAGPHPPCSEASCSLQSPLHWHPLAALHSLNKAVNWSLQGCGLTVVGGSWAPSVSPAKSAPVINGRWH